MPKAKKTSKTLKVRQLRLSITDHLKRYKRGKILSEDCKFFMVDKKKDAYYAAVPPLQLLEKKYGLDLPILLFAQSQEAVKFFLGADS
jgi:hypothetical protein